MHERPLRRRAALVAALALATALVVTTGAGWLQARNASVRIVQATAQGFMAGVSGELRGGPPSEEGLADLLDEWSDAGLRALRWTDGTAVLAVGDAVEVEVLARLGTSDERPPRGARPLTVRVGDRVRVVAPARPARRGRRGRSARPRGTVSLSFEPVESMALEASAARVLGVGAGAGLVLVLFALVLGRQWLAAEALERERASERHLAMLGTMSAVLGHEIKNPLASLKGNAQLLERKLTDPDLARKASRVVSEAVRLEALTARILAFARSEPMTPEPAELTALVGRVLERLDEQGEVDAPASLPVTVDVQWVEQAIENLLRNARQAAGEDGQVAVMLQVRGGRVSIAVDDSGPGIPPDVREQVLRPFHTDRVQGTGLGLAVVDRVAREHGGRVEIGESPLGGARVAFTVESR
ncbi:MAG: HAMP domain-containing histidine kinase [Deltaproteobacteria bacterium]|nr:HAMP domain-containing histidine kinase [Deltaproteobacteria bacterium]